MNYAMMRYILSSVLLFEGGFLLLPCIIALIYGESVGLYYLLAAGLCFLLGVLGRLRRPASKILYAGEGFVSVSLSWILLSLLGSLPFWLSGEFPKYIDALFETVSGFTTTGATVLSDVEILSRASLFWRCFTHWIGGMGVLVLILAILPISGSYNMHLMRAESPGPVVGKLVPKVKSTAMILYGIYIIITLSEMIALMLAGMSPYESVTLSFSTVGTGGFGLLNSSVAEYNLAVQVIIEIFMLLCSINFGLFYLMIKKKPKEAFMSEELRCFLFIIVCAAVLITADIKSDYGNVFQAFHEAMFQVISIISTTGFATTDFNQWPEFSKMIIIFLILIGACAGSTGGGFKVSRLLILLRSAKNEIVRSIHPQSVRKVHLDGKTVSDSVVRNVQCYLVIYVMIAVISCVIVSLDNFSFSTNLSAVMTSLNNVGPGLDVVGPTGNFGDYSILSKLVLMVDMLIGRLELYPLIILFAVPLWKNR